jgi:hypothetical protein
VNPHPRERRRARGRQFKQPHHPRCEDASAMSVHPTPLNKISIIATHHVPPTVSAEYITNILETRARALPEPGPLQLSRRHDLLDIDIAPPDLNAYEVNDHDPE